MKQDQILAIDNGTQSVRALVFDLHGNLIAKSQVMLEMYFSAQPGWAEQQPAHYWDAVCQACQALWQMPGVEKGAILGVALTTQRGTVINLDKDGNPLRPAIVWMDMRRTAGLKPVGGAWGAIFKLIRMEETIGFIQAEAEANWLRTHQPDIWGRTHKYLMLSGYLTYRLTGQYRDSVGAQVGYLPFDYKNLRWASASDWKWLAVPMKRDILPELIPPTAPLGQITAEAAAATGIPAGLPLIAAAADKACEALGAGAAAPDVACLSYGTNATVSVMQTKYREVRPFIPPWPAAIPGGYSLEISVYRGFWMVNWFKEQFGQLEQEAARSQGKKPEELFDALLAGVSPGSMGLMLQPYWSPGVKVPGPEAKGAIIGWGDVHTRAHLYRAILEGLVYALREGKEHLEGRTGVPVRELRVAGGGSQSDAAMQITADVFGMAAARPHLYETSGLGAAINASVGLGCYPDVPAAVRAMTRLGRVFEPDPQVSAVYAGLYTRVYKQMYRQLKTLYEQIRAVTGYPPRP